MSIILQPLILILIFKILMIGWFVSNFTPLQDALKTILRLNLKPLWRLVCKMLLTMLECYKCASFWTGLIIAHDLFIASLCAFLALIYVNRLKCYEEYIKII